MVVEPVFKTFKACIEPQHWQLRDLIMPEPRAASESLVFPESHNLMRLDLSRNKIEKIAQLPRAPHCLRAGADFVVCGGSGHICVIASNSGQVVRQPIGTELINSVLIQDTDIIASSNDDHIYLGRVQDEGSAWRSLGRLDTGMAVNCTAISPQGNLMAVCGDDKVLQFYSSMGPHAWSCSSLVKPVGDVGMSVAFSPCGQMVAAAFQCGNCYLYDIRNLRDPLHQIRTRENCRRRSIFRTVKFSDPMHDLMLLSEERGVVRVLDLRDLNQHLLYAAPPNLSGKVVVTKHDAGHVPEVEADRRHLDVVGLSWSTTMGGQIVAATSSAIYAFPSLPRNIFPEYQFR